MRRFLKPLRAFSLIEILIVITITGFLSTYMLFTVVNKLELGRDAKRKIDIERIDGGLNEFYETSGCYPQSLENCNESLSIGTNIFINSIPCDIKTNQPYFYETEVSFCPQWFRLYTLLENNDDRSIKYTNCVEGCGPNCQYNYGISSSNTTLEFCGLEATPLIPSLITPLPSDVQSPTSADTTTTTPTPTIELQFACAPGGGQTGRCMLYDDPVESECPEVYPNDPNCEFQCYLKTNRCKTASGLENACANEESLAAFIICIITNFLNNLF